MQAKALVSNLQQMHPQTAKGHSAMKSYKYKLCRGGLNMALFSADTNSGRPCPPPLPPKEREIPKGEILHSRCQGDQTKSEMSLRRRERHGYFKMSCPI